MIRHFRIKNKNQTNFLRNTFISDNRNIFEEPKTNQWTILEN